MEGFVVSVPHFVERHGLVVIVALGESVVVIGAGAAGLPLDAGLVLVALLSLSLSAALWWVYFSDEDDVERAFEDAPPERRPELALRGFGYWHYGLLLGDRRRRGRAQEGDRRPVRARSTHGSRARLRSAPRSTSRPTSASGGRSASQRNRVRLVAAAVALATIPLGTEVGAAAQVGAIAALVTVALAAE